LRPPFCPCTSKSKQIIKTNKQQQSKILLRESIFRDITPELQTTYPKAQMRDNSLDKLELQSRLYDILLDINRGKPYVTSAQIQQFLELVELKFGILIDTDKWDTVKLFVSRYLDLCVDKNIFLEFLNDLVQLDFVQYVMDRYEPKNYGVTSTLGSPLALTEKLRRPQLQPDYMKVSNHISDSIEKLATRVLPKHPEKPVIKISVLGSVRSFLKKIPSLLPYLNTLLLLLLIFLLISQNISLKHHVFPLIERFFLYDTADDIYWWQRYRWCEEFVWSILERIQE
jgi:hypothetical protein